MTARIKPALPIYCAALLALSLLLAACRTEAPAPSAPTAIPATAAAATASPLTQAIMPAALSDQG